jgi:hypothetical protein
MVFRAGEWPPDPGCHAPRRMWFLGWAPNGLALDHIIA